MSSRLHRHPSRFWHFSAPCTSIVIPGCVTLSPRRPRDGCAASLWAWRRSELPGLSGSLSTLFRLRLTFSPPTSQQYPPICHLSHTRGLASLSLSFFFFFVEYVGLWLRARQSRRTFVCQQPVTAREAILERASNKPQTKRKNWEAGRIRRLCSFITFSHISSDLPHLLGRALLYGRSCGPVVSLLPSSATRRTKHQQQHSTITSPQRSQRLSIRAGLATASFFPPSTHICHRSLNTARMPYTPPAQLSPAASKPNSPAPSRSHSWLQSKHTVSESAPLERLSLPRSTGSSSYLSKHRRSPSLQKQQDDIAAVDFATGANGIPNSEAFRMNGNVDPHGSLRQSPPPVNNTLIPTGATISPPESSHNSSDEEEVLAAVRGREGRQLENLEELQAAIRIIEQRKESSPNRHGNERKRVHMAGDLMIPQVDGHLQSDTLSSADSSRPPLSREARKISHSRSSTDSNIVFSNSAHQVQSPVQYKQESSADEDDENDESDEAIGTRRPAMVRKKSGELVRPALRASSSKRRPSSMPGTPTYSKAVHFDSHLEHVRHFLQVDRPLAVSAGSSPVEAYESEAEFPFGGDEAPRPSKRGYEWEIRLASFPPETEERKHLPVRVERVFLSADNKSLVGTIAVQNLAFQKFVITRFTLDYWKTTSEVVADYNNDVRKKYTDGCDRFSFTIKLADQVNLENKTLFFCVRYEANGQHFWDSNNNLNYQVDFTKKAKTQPATNNSPGLGARPLNALPRSGRSPPATAGSRPKSMPASFDDFATGFDNFGTFGHTSPLMLMGETSIKLKNPRPRQDSVPEAPVRRAKPNAQAFGNRYDFGASLTAAIQNASSILGEQSGLPVRPDTKQSSREVPAVAAKGAVASAQHLENGVKLPSVGQVSSALAAGTVTSKPSALVSEKPSLQSQSYQELVDKYCFFGSAAKPAQLTKEAIRSMDGTNDNESISTVSVRSDGSRTPTPPRSHSPSPPTELSSVKVSPQLSRSSSPLPRTGAESFTRAISPVSFGYPYHDNGNGLMVETPPTTAIHG